MGIIRYAERFYVIGRTFLLHKNKEVLKTPP